MKRITYYNSLNEPCFELDGTVYSGNDVSRLLAAYENTGLSPKEIIELRDKHTPQKPYNHNTAHKGICPHCLSVEDSSANYCRACGQALNFSEKPTEKHSALSFTDVLAIPEARQLVDFIEELAFEEDTQLVKMRNYYINELFDKYGYKYTIHKN